MSLLGAGNQPTLVIGFTTWRPDKGQPRAHEAAYAAVATLLMGERFNGRPHWAKNEASTFAQGNWGKVYGDGYDSFKEVRKQLDPAGMFLNTFAKDLGM